LFSSAYQVSVYGCVINLFDPGQGAFDGLIKVLSCFYWLLIISSIFIYNCSYCSFLWSSSFNLFTSSSFYYFSL